MDSPAQHIQPIILSGGSGTRLWPLSRNLHPKQFLALKDGESLFQNTVRRICALPNALPPLIICNHEHRFMVAEQLREMGTEATIYLEPVGRDTAPAVALAALGVLEHQDAPLLVAPADHAIDDTRAFCERVHAALPAAENGSLVTFGVTPTHPATGFGYIKPAPAPVADWDALFRVERFIEKPDAARATQFLAQGGYFWNSGIFLFKASTYLDELQRHAPQVESACRRAFANRHMDLDFVRMESGAFEACPSVSIDHAVMEHTDKACMMPLGTPWSDLGSWSALAESVAGDDQGNVIIGDVVHADTRNCYLRAEKRLLAVIGLEGHIVVETTDAVLVASKEKASEVKSLVQKLRRMGRRETENHTRVYRPWGYYEGITQSERSQVKRILVKPGSSLSLQKHHHRAEHWVVVKGTATVTCNDKTFLLSEDQSTYVPIGAVHRLENHGKIPLELIEVQTGSYLGEDDIVRMEDRYGR